MSLKAFHVFFIIVSTLFTLGFAVWGTRDFAETGIRLHLALGVASFFTSGLLVWYGIWFIRKLKHVSYL
jgi:hypothetical protein